MSHLTSKRGVTLIEMLIVIIIVAVTAAMVVPSVSKGTRRTRVNRAASLVSGDLELAFSSAARQRKPIRVSFTSGSLSYTISDRATGSVLITRDFGPTSELALGSFSASAAVLDIYPSGIASGPDTVSFALGSSTRKVTVSRVGIIRGIS